MTTVQPPAWETLEFKYYPTDYLYRARGSRSSGHAHWEPGEILPADTPLALSPAAAVLSYGCGILEGLKATRCADGRVLLFRPRDHAARFGRSANRLSMPPFPCDRFIEAATEVVSRNLRFVPPAGKGTFYLRPTQHAVDEMLGLRPGENFVVTVYGSPVGDFQFTADDMGLRLQALPFARAAVGGTGAAKAIGNYAGTIQDTLAARQKSCDAALYLNGDESSLIGECGGANFFCYLDSGVLVTPALNDTILPGISRDSAIRVAQDLGIPVEERELGLGEVLEAGQECFCTGTAWTLRSISAIDITRCPLFDDPSLCGARSFTEKKVARAIHSTLQEIQNGQRDDIWGWTHSVQDHI